MEAYKYILVADKNRCSNNTINSSYAGTDELIRATVVPCSARCRGEVQVCNADVFISTVDKGDLEDSQSRLYYYYIILYINNIIRLYPSRLFPMKIPDGAQTENDKKKKRGLENIEKSRHRSAGGAKHFSGCLLTQHGVC